MGADAFGTQRFRCNDKSGCLCSEFCSTLDAMDEDERVLMEQQSRSLTCQRKSELLLFCRCGHPAWVHSSEPDHTPLEGSETTGDGSGGPWSALLRGNGLLHLSGTLEDGLTVEDAYTHLDRSRPELLQLLRELGVDALKDRQGVCNMLARARRLAALARERAAQAKVAGATAQPSPRWTIQIDGPRGDNVPVAVSGSSASCASRAAAGSEA